jgi:hypothetical protein
MLAPVFGRTGADAVHARPFMLAWKVHGRPISEDDAQWCVLVTECPEPYAAVCTKPKNQRAHQCSPLSAAAVGEQSGAKSDVKYGIYAVYTQT